MDMLSPLTLTNSPLAVAVVILCFALIVIAWLLSRRLAGAAQRYEELQIAYTTVNAEKGILAEQLTSYDTLRREAVATLERERAAVAANTDKLLLSFKGLAADVLKEHTKDLSEQSQVGLRTLLSPFTEELGKFREKVEGVHNEEVRAHATLEKELQSLRQLNQTLSTDAKNLTDALRGSRKAQGTWGEVVLERLLEQAGLRNGEEFLTQLSFTRDDGSRAQPDVVLRLPQGRHLVLDAKVSLTAYEAWAQAEDEATKGAHRKSHIEALEVHVRTLAERKYEHIAELNTPDFVVLFVPIEPAFALAVSESSSLLNLAWERNVLLVSPSTLLFVLRTVAFLWRQEAQSKNVLQISEQGARLYDAFVAFVEDVDKVGDRLRQAQSSFTTARAKLCTQRGNLVSAAQKLTNLGVKATKSLPERVVVEALDTSGHEETVTETSAPLSLV